MTSNDIMYNSWKIELYSCSSVLFLFENVVQMMMMINILSNMHMDIYRLDDNHVAYALNTTTLLLLKHRTRNICVRCWGIIYATVVTIQNLSVFLKEKLQIGPTYFKVWIWIIGLYAGHARLVTKSLNGLSC